MNEIKVVSERQFREILGLSLGQNIERAGHVLKNYGSRLSWDVCNVMLHAVDQHKSDEVLTVLEEHWVEHLQFQHPKIRGTVSNCFGVNETQLTFLRICNQILALTPTPESV